MSKVKDLLLSRKKELVFQLENLKHLQDELAEVETALQSLESVKKCDGRPCINGNGCDECRSGWSYR